MNRAFYLLSTLLVLLTAYNLQADSKHFEDPYTSDYILATLDTIPVEPRYGDFISDENNNPFDLKDPASVTKDVEYDPITNQYIVTEKIGEEYYRMPTYMSFREYLDYRAKKQEQDYFNQLSGVSGGDRSGSGKVDPIAKVDVNNTLIDRLFGGNSVDIRPQGNIDLTFGVDFQRVENPTFTERQRRQGGFDFDMAIQMNVTGKIGEKLNLSTSYNTQATFDFDNQMKLDYDTDAFSEDEIIKKIEAGNVSLPLNGSLIQGSQSLFGLKTELQFGHLRLTAVASQQKSEQKEITIEGGSQFQEFEVFADEYDENRHFFLSHYNRDAFEESLEQLPQVRSLFRIEQLDVWITNDRNATEETRDIVAIADLGEPTQRTTSPGVIDVVNPPRFRDITGLQGLPDNNANDLYQELINNPQSRRIERAVATLQNRFNLQQAKDFEKVRARRLRQGTEYTFHPELGFVSINVNVRPDQVIGVAFQYSYNGKTYKVGEIYNEIPGTGTERDSSAVVGGGVQTDSTRQASAQNVIFLKMLKSTTPRVDLPTWDLMMKNFYSIGAYQVSQEDFKLDVFYDDPGQGQKRFLPNNSINGQDLSIGGKPLLRVFELDQLNVQRDPQPDGIFDFVPGLTIYPNNGRVMFPVLEPFGSSLAEEITPDIFDSRYTYQQLYDSTVTVAREYPELNRFAIRGSYRSSISSEISLGAFNIPPGSVQVYAGGLLEEGRDYEIDYNIGRIKILRDDLLNAGTPIRVKFEDSALFGFNTKTMVGLRADYDIGDDFTLGATYLHLFERPFTQKVNIGDDPINNRIYGVDFSVSKEAPWLTKAVDAIPLLSTKAESSISFTAEAAALKPGHAKAINQEKIEEQITADGDTIFNTVRDKEGGGTVYIDDFEGSASNIDLRIPANAWVLSSVPRNDDRNNNPLFPEADEINSTLTNVNRAHLNWYRIDQSVRNDQDRTENPYTSAVPQIEVFPNLQLTPDQLPNIQTFDLTYYPEERGSYNFDVPGGTQYSAGLKGTGELEAPQTRWAGIMRALNSTQNFEAANVESIQFWMLSPFHENPNAPGSEGDLYINLGNISEDIMRDSRQFYERALPTGPDDNRPVIVNNLGRVPIRAPVGPGGFDTQSEENIIAQDVGLDGLDDAGETSLFADYLQQVSSINAQAFAEIQADPSKDNYLYYNDRSLDDNAPVLERYRRYNHTQGNTPPNQNDVRARAATQIPDSEDLDNDRSLNETESYFQYRIPIRRDGNEIDVSSNPYIVDRVESDATFNGERRVWYRMKIPLNDINRKSVGGIQDFRSIRFIRMYMNGFERQTTLRFARLELVRNQWRAYTQQPLTDPGVFVDNDGRNPTTFDVTAINIEQNSDKTPFPYVLPLGIQREQNIGVFNALQNEQSLALNACNLEDGDARAIYKLINLDMRVYERLKMFVHAETDQMQEIPDGELSLFLRLGSDFNNNYYEYEVPLVMSDSSVLAGLSDQQVRREIWKTANELDFPLELFRNAKIERNNRDFPLTKVFDEVRDSQEGKEGNSIKVKGNPNLGFVKAAMIGIRNRNTNDGDKYCAEVWVNELRLSGLDERGGAAAIGRLDIQLADFGNVTVAGNISSIGFGGLDQQLSERQREQVSGYDIAGNFELGKFLPEQTGIKIPFYAQYSNTTSTPEYDPYDLDIVLKDKLANTDNAADRDSIRRQAQTAQEIKSIAFTNVRKERTNTESKPMPWDISNFSFTYSHNNTVERDPIVESQEVDDYRGAIDYTFSRQVKYIEPLKKVIKKDKYLKFLSQMNFNPLPNSFSFSTVMDRQFAETKYRFTDFDPIYTTFYNKYFTWDRNYNLQWDFTKNLKFNFNASNQAVIDEPEEIDLETATRVDPQVRKDSILTNIRDLGRPKNYQHQFTLNYTLPFKMIPFLDWINVKAQYGGNYSWSAASLNTIGLGNVIQNQQTRSINGDLNFEKLYNYSKYLKKINSKPRRGNSNRGSSRSSRGSKDKEGKDKEKKNKKKANREPSKAERIAIRPLMLLRKARFNYSEDFSTVVPGFRPETRFLGQNEGFESPGWDFVAGLQPNIRNLQESEYGTDQDWLYQQSQARLDRGLNSYLVDTIFLNQQVQQTYNQSLDLKVTIEPFKDFRLDLEANRQFSENHTEYFKDTTAILDRNLERIANGFYEPEFVRAVPRNVGSMSITYFALNTLWQDSDDQITALFRRFEDNRINISQRLGQGRHDDDNLAGQGYTEGYGRNQQDVLIPAFLAAYTEKDIETVEVDTNYTRNVLFKELPRINWRFSYNGLSKVPLFQEIFQSVNLTHGYRSNLTVNSFATSLNYLTERANGLDLLNDNTLNFYSRLEIPELVISEQFAPLLAVDVRLKNEMSLNLDFKKSRTLAMSFVSDQLNETQSEEYTLGFSYRLKEFEFPFAKGNKKRGRKPKVDEEAPAQGNRPQQRGGGNQASVGDLDINFDFSFGNNVTFVHILDQLGTKEPTRGERTLRISPSADYQVNEQLTLVFFFDYNRRIPRVSSSFPITNTRGGVTVRFSLN